MVTGRASGHAPRTRAREREWLVEHNDLLEDVILAALVASTTVVTLYVGWRAGRAARKRERVRGADGAPSVEPAPIGDEPAFRRESMVAWSRRLAGEQARSARHGSPASVVALRFGHARGPLSRRSEDELRRATAGADLLVERTRASDVVHVTGDGVIRVLLVDATDDGAHRFVDRVSDLLRADPSSGGREVVATWASIAPSRDLFAADRLAAARLRGAAGGWLRSLAVHRAGDDAMVPTEAAREHDGRPLERTAG